MVLLKAAWSGRDPEYVQRIEAAQETVALQDQTPWSGGAPTELEYDFKDGVKFPKSIRTVEGRQVDFVTGHYNADASITEWESIDHYPVHYSRNGGKTWWWKRVGILRHPETGEFLVWRSDEKTKKRTEVEGVVGADIHEAAAFLTPAERASLGLPEVFDAQAFAQAQAEQAGVAVESTEGDTTDEKARKEAERKAALEFVVKSQKDLLRRIVADEAKPDVAMEFAAEMVAQELEARARGASKGKSRLNRARIKAQAAQRGAEALGWGESKDNWEKQGRVLKPGAEPYWIYKPVVGSANPARDEDETTTGTGEQGDTASPSRMRARRNADGTVLYGYTLVQTYDWTQTVRADGQPDPDWSTTIPGGDAALLAKFKASSPLPIVEDHGGNHTGTAHGWTNDRKIVIDPHRSIGSQISTLAHEMGHVELGHIEAIKSGSKTRAECEQEAQLVAYQVTRALKLGDDADEATTQATADYLRNWQKADGTQATGHKARWTLLQERLAVSSPAAERILARFYGLDSEQEQAKAA